MQNSSVWQLGSPVRTVLHCCSIQPKSGYAEPGLAEESGEGVILVTPEKQPPHDTGEGASGIGDGDPGVDELIGGK